MKQFIILCIVLFFQTYSNAQFGSQQIISTEANLARAVYAADLDGDGEMDVLSASEADDKVAWYKNIIDDGLGSFGPQQIITESLDAAIDVFATDIDGDGDMDVLSAAKQDDRIVWFRNTDGMGNFSPQIIITNLTNGAISVFATDLDGDGDVDVLSASYNDNKIAWYENTDGLGSFGAQQIITNQAQSTRDVYAADLDGDGDMDVLAASTASDEILWFENTDGLGNFGVEKIISSNSDGVLSVFATDIDGDGDMDVLSADFGDDTVAWFENTNGQGNFGSKQIISTTVLFTKSVYAADLDNDGDMDVLSASSSNSESVLYWYENINGFGIFGSEQVITTNVDGVRDIFTSDIDNDGDMDVLSASPGDDKIAWYENYTILGVEETLDSKIKIHPNPANTILYISNSSNYSINSLQITDLQGKLVIQVHNNTSQQDISSLVAGVYFVKIITDKGSLVKKIIKE